MQWLFRLIKLKHHMPEIHQLCLVGFSGQVEITQVFRGLQIHLEIPFKSREEIPMLNLLFEHLLK